MKKKIWILLVDERMAGVTYFTKHVGRVAYILLLTIGRRSADVLLSRSESGTFCTSTAGGTVRRWSAGKMIRAVTSLLPNPVVPKELICFRNFLLFRRRSAKFCLDKIISRLSILCHHELLESRWIKVIIVYNKIYIMLVASQATVHATQTQSICVVLKLKLPSF